MMTIVVQNNINACYCYGIGATLEQAASALFFAVNYQGVGSSDSSMFQAFRIIVRVCLRGPQGTLVIYFPL